MGGQDDDGDLSTNGRIRNPPPQSPSRGYAGESSSSVPSPLPSFSLDEPMAPDIYPEILYAFRHLSLDRNNRSSRHRSLEEDISSSSSHPGSSPGSSRSDFGKNGIAPYLPRYSNLLESYQGYSGYVGSSSGSYQGYSGYGVGSSSGSYQGYSGCGVGSSSGSYQGYSGYGVGSSSGSYQGYSGYGVGSSSESYKSFPRYGVGNSLESYQTFPGYGPGNSSSGGLFSRNNGFPDFTPSPNGGITIYGAPSPSRGITIYGADTFQVPKLKFLRGNVVTLVQGHGGSKVLQDSIDAVGSYSEIDEVLPEFTDNIAYLMLSPTGNPVVQKLIEKSNDSQRNSIARALSRTPSELYNICRNSHGTRAVQRLLESLNTPVELRAMVAALSQYTEPLSRDSNGYHVIAHCLNLPPEILSTKIIFDVAQNCLELATDKSGCCIVQLCIDQLCINHGDGLTSEMIERNIASEMIIRDIIQNAFFLSQDCFGNYVVQHLVTRALGLNACLVHSLRGSYVNLSMNKYGSNVVERCLKVSNEDQVAMIVRELISFPRVSDLLTDQYGNYVVQSALNVSQGGVRASLVNTIKSYAPMMVSHVYGMKIINCLRKKRLYPSQ